ncbi:hypothetical protein VDGD_01011 [Verticillium dahliae]|nr:hypothetical protein VDGD_01011 [Verticillium dahliae]
MFTISVNPLIEWASNIPGDSPWNLAVIMPLILLGLYYLFGSIHAIMLFSDWFGNRFTSVTGAATDNLLTRAMYLGLWLDGSILLIAAVLVSPLGILAAMATAPFVALAVAGKRLLRRRVAAWRGNGKGLVEMMFLDFESPVQVAAVAFVAGGLILGHLWTI